MVLSRKNISALLLQIFALSHFISVADGLREKKNLMIKGFKKQVEMQCNALFVRGQYLFKMLVKRAIQLTSFYYLRSWNYNRNNSVT